MLDFNRTTTKAKAASDAVNACIDAALEIELAGQTKREHLGASSLGSECLRQIQWNWQYPVQPEPRTERIFARGRWLETYAANLLHAAGFRIVRNGPALEFSQMGGKFQGHADGIVVAPPDGVEFGCPAVWECKGLGSKGWTKLQKDGLARTYPGYADQVALYQAYFDLTEHPALFTACNMDTMEMLHLLVPFDAARAQAASDRAVVIINATEAGETLPRGGASPDAFVCKWCKHAERCWA